MRSDLAAHRPRSAYPVTSDPRDLTGTEEVVKRNALIFMLREWSAGWPPEVEQVISTPESVDLPPRSNNHMKLSNVEWDVLTTLLKANRPLSQTGIRLESKNDNREIGKSSIKKATPKLKNHGLIEHPQASKSRGFLLTAKGRDYVAKGRDCESDTE
jgi:hypothetical protein